MAISLKNVNDRLTVVENRKYGHLFPDYSKATKLDDSSSGYKPPSNGFMSFDMFEDAYNTAWVTINGKRFYQQSDTHGTEGDGSITLLLPVTTTDTISWWCNGLNFNSGIGVFFIPAKTLYYKVLEQIKYLFKEVLS